MTSIEAKQFLDPQGGIVASAHLLAAEVVRHLTGGSDVVHIDLRSLRGLSSSYYNVLLQRIATLTTLADFPRRVRIRFDSAAQEQVFNRSFEAAQRGAA